MLDLAHVLFRGLSYFLGKFKIGIRLQVRN